MNLILLALALYFAAKELQLNSFGSLLHLPMDWFVPMHISRPGGGGTQPCGAPGSACIQLTSYIMSLLFTCCHFEFYSCIVYLCCSSIITIVSTAPSLLWMADNIWIQMNFWPFFRYSLSLQNTIHHCYSSKTVGSQFQGFCNSSDQERNQTKLFNQPRLSNLK